MKMKVNNAEIPHSYWTFPALTALKQAESVVHFAHDFSGVKTPDSASDSVIFTNLYCPRLLYGKAIHQPGKLLPGERFHLTGTAGPLEAAGVPV